MVKVYCMTHSDAARNVSAYYSLKDQIGFQPDFLKGRLEQGTLDLGWKDVSKLPLPPE